MRVWNTPKGKSRAPLTVALALCLSFVMNVGNAYAANRPFPQQRNYVGKIKPSHVTQTQMNTAVASYYGYWKQKYVKSSNGATPGGGYYVAMTGTGGTGNEITTSEAHGYGMILFALMGGKDAQAQQYFDGMYNMYDKHRSTINRNLMSWIIDQSESTSADSDSATDGDMDIAYALLLAHYQWGSAGKINYLNEAKRIINLGLKGSDVHTSSKRTMLGDWSTDQWATRPSDWMTGHMHAYFEATKDPFWNDTATTVYSMIDSFTRTYSPGTGLISDFVIGSTPRPAPPNFLEAATDDDYSWNSCRYPLRIAMDAAHFQRPEAKAAMTKVIGWLENTTNQQPSGILAGYRLNGSPMVGYSSMAFTAPFIAAATVATGNHQTFVNRGWDVMVTQKDSYYDDSINLLSMLFISGNWWAPIASDGGSGGGETPSQITARASAADSIYVAPNTLDGSLDPNSRWSAYGRGQWIEYDLGQSQTVQAVDLAFFKGNERRASFEIYLTNAAGQQTKVFTGQSNGTSLGFQRFDVPDQAARYVRIVGNGNNLNLWNSLTEVKIVTAASSTASVNTVATTATTSSAATAPVVQTSTSSVQTAAPNGSLTPGAFAVSTNSITTSTSVTKSLASQLQ
ncbi:MAG: discoidin domain-containing protein [Gammaproteobacteria bacterium]|nr:discoidin domain-containing protein [Gammaproteobacteria bacterium]